MAIWGSRSEPKLIEDLAANHAMRTMRILVFGVQKYINTLVTWLGKYKNRIEIYDDADDVDAQFSAGCWQAACRVGRRGLSDMRIVRLRRAG